LQTCPFRCIHGSGICLRFSKIFPKPSASCIRSTLTRRAPGFLSTGTPAPSKQLVALVPRTFPLADSSRSFSFDFDENTQMLPLPCMHRGGQKGVSTWSPGSWPVCTGMGRIDEVPTWSPGSWPVCTGAGRIDTEKQCLAMHVVICYYI